MLQLQDRMYLPYDKFLRRKEVDKRDQVIVNNIKPKFDTRVSIRITTTYEKPQTVPNANLVGEPYFMYTHFLGRSGPPRSTC